MGTNYNNELTKVIPQNDERSDIDCQTEHFSYSHGPMPGSYRQGNHQQFCQNQGSEGYGHHMNKVLVKKPQSTVNNDTTWKKRFKKCMSNINIVSAIYAIFITSVNMFYDYEYNICLSEKSFLIKDY